ncbi:unnamed protein product, partial [Phaeothamnion confervicola]
GVQQSLGPKAVRPVLYTSHFLCSWCERMWQYSIVVFLSDITSGLVLVSSYGLFLCLAAVGASPTIGRWIDALSRLRALRIISAVRNAAIALGALTAYTLMGCGKDGQMCSPTLFLVLLVSMHVVGATASLGSRAQVIALEADWVVVLSHGASPWLTETNATMRRIDLSCDLLAPAAVGLLVTAGSAQVAALTLAACNMLSVGVELASMAWLHATEPALATKPQQQQQLEKNPFAASLSSASSSTANCVSSLRLYLRQPVAGAALALMLLHLTVLSFGPVMIAYLRLSGESDAVVGGARSACAAFGFAGTLLLPWLAARVGLETAGMLSVWLQFICLAAGALELALPPTGGGAVAGTRALIVGVVASRSGLWGFDLAVTQLIQERVPEAERGVFNGTQKALEAVMETLSYVAALVFHRPEQFRSLVAMSCGSVGTAAILFSAHRAAARR